MTETLKLSRDSAFHSRLVLGFGGGFFLAWLDSNMEYHTSDIKKTQEKVIKTHPIMGSLYVINKILSQG